MDVSFSINQELFARVVTEAKMSAFGKDSWVRAIDRAVAMLEHYPMAVWDGHSLLIMSPNSSNIYTVNGACMVHSFGQKKVPCPAFRHKTPCWHRCLARLLRNYFQAVQVDLVNHGRLEIHF